MKRLWLLLPFLATGCLPFSRDETPMVRNDSFAPVIPESRARPVPTDAPPAAQEIATRVTQVGLKVVEANKVQLGLRPTFSTIGIPQTEIFHRGTSEVFVTEGLARQCATDGQLAALLALELGKMVSEREAAAGFRAYDREPPPDAGGRDAGGSFGAPDGTRLYELSQYEKVRRRPGTPPPPPPDSRLLARNYLQQAGFSAADLEAALPLVKQAQGNSALEKQMINGISPSKPVAK